MRVEEQIHQLLRHQAVATWDNVVKLHRTAATSICQLQDRNGPNSPGRASAPTCGCQQTPAWQATVQHTAAEGALDWRPIALQQVSANGTAPAAFAPMLPAPHTYGFHVEQHHAAVQHSRGAQLRQSGGWIGVSLVPARWDACMRGARAQPAGPTSGPMLSTGGVGRLQLSMSWLNSTSGSVHSTFSSSMPCSEPAAAVPPSPCQRRWKSGSAATTCGQGRAGAGCASCPPRWLACRGGAAACTLLSQHAQCAAGSARTCLPAGPLPSP